MKRTLFALGCAALLILIVPKTRAYATRSLENYLGNELTLTHHGHGIQAVVTDYFLPFLAHDVRVIDLEPALVVGLHEDLAPTEAYVELSNGTVLPLAQEPGSGDWVLRVPAGTLQPGSGAELKVLHGTRVLATFSVGGLQ